MLTAAALVIVVTVALSPVLLVALHRYQIIDEPSQRSSHTVPTARGGGLVPATAALGALVAGVVTGAPRAGLLVAAGGFAAIGLIEDLRGVPPLRRLGLQLVVSVAALPWLLHGVDGSPLLRAALVLLTLQWMVGYANAFNFMDGVNGISVVQVIAVGLSWFAVGLIADVPALAAGSLLVMAAAAGFLPFNFPTAMVFLGDVGSYFFGAWLAALVVVGVLAGVPAVAMLAPLGISLADTSYTLLRRVRQREVWHRAHRDHVYQQLVLLGWSHAQTTGFVGVLTAACGLLGLYSASAPMPARAAATVAVALVLAGYLVTPRLVAARGRRYPAWPGERLAARSQARS